MKTNLNFTIEYLKNINTPYGNLSEAVRAFSLRKFHSPFEEGIRIKERIAIDNIVLLCKNLPINQKVDIFKKVMDGNHNYHHGNPFYFHRNRSLDYIADKQGGFCQSFMLNGFSNYVYEGRLKDPFRKLINFLKKVTPEECKQWYKEYYPFVFYAGPNNVSVEVRFPNMVFLEYYLMQKYEGELPYQVRYSEHLSNEYIDPKIGFYECPTKYKEIHGRFPPDDTWGAYSVKKRRSISKGKRFNVFKRDGYKCAICGKTPKEDGVKLEVDHIYPVSKGGGNDMDNLQTLCYDCNRGKKDKLM